MSARQAQRTWFAVQSALTGVLERGAAEDVQDLEEELNQRPYYKAPWVHLEARTGQIIVQVEVEGIDAEDVELQVVDDLLDLASGVIREMEEVVRLQILGVWPSQGGPHTGESMAAHGLGGAFTAAERAQINAIGHAAGCHLCGSTNPGTQSGNFIMDHQPPSIFKPSMQRRYPQCLRCSRDQGREVSEYLRLDRYTKNYK